MTMSTPRILLISAALVSAMTVMVPTSESATSFIGSTIISMDESQRTITFQTKEGEKWTLPVDDPALLKPERIARGDQVSIEIDLNDHITQIRKPSDSSQPATGEARDDASQ